MNLEIDGFHEAGVSLGNFLTDIHVGGLRFVSAGIYQWSFLMLG